MMKFFSCSILLRNQRDKFFLPINSMGINFQMTILRKNMIIWIKNIKLHFDRKYFKSISKLQNFLCINFYVKLII